MLTHPLDWSAMPRLPSDARLPVLTIKPYPDEHFPFSRREIAAAARAMRPGGRVQVYGAGRCNDIPVAALAEQFSEVVLYDLYPDKLREGLARATDLRHPARVRPEKRDHNGMTERFRAACEADIAHVRDVRTAAGRVGELMDRTDPLPVERNWASGGGPASGVFDMTVCSGVLTQIDSPLWRAATGLLRDRFGSAFDKPLVDELRTHQRPMGHRFRMQLMAQLHAGTRPGGRVWLSDTLRVAHLDIADGVWRTQGAYRMGLLESLSDYVDKRFVIESRHEWDWVEPDDDDPAAGRLWRVHALLLTRQPERNELHQPGLVTD